MAVYETYGAPRGSAAALGNTPMINVGTLDLGTLQTEAPLLATDSTNLTNESGSLTTFATYATGTLTLGHTLVSGDITVLTAAVAQVGSLATTAANIATESAAITGAVGTVTNDIFLAVNTGSSANNMDLRLAMKAIEGFLLGGIPVGHTQFPVN